MTLHTLEDRFNARATAIYQKFSNPQTLDEIKPNTPESRSRIKTDSQLLPVVSTIRDTNLISKFLKTSPGLLFLGKQTLLQTGNTFAETRLYNPASTLINTVPTVHSTRHIGKPSSFSLASLLNPTRDNRGAMQQETVLRLTQEQSGGFIQTAVRGLTNAVLSPFRALTTTQTYSRPEDEAFKKFGPLLPTPVPTALRGNLRGIPYSSNSKVTIDNNIQPLFELTGKNPASNGFLTNLQVTKGSATGRTRVNGLSNQTYSFENSYVSGILKHASKFIIKDYRNRNSITSTVTSGPLSQAISSTVDKVRYEQSRISSTTTTTTSGIQGGQFVLADISRMSPAFDEQYEAYALQTTDGTLVGDTTKNKTFMALVESQKPYFEYGKKFTDGYQTGDNQGIAKDEDRRYTSTIRDAFNLGTTNKTEGELQSLINKRVVYTPIIRTDEKETQEGKADIIRFIFRSTDNSDPVHFRAFISSLSESVLPEFNEQRYLGRTERFVTYAGAKRSISISFNIVAFSENELDNLWLRMNYLTGLAFPKGVSTSGFMIPPLFKLTIGKIYENQPCYIETMESQLLDDKITFDIDEEVSKIINVTMTISLLEKTSRFYDSPFYAISEKISANELSTRTPVPSRLVSPIKVTAPTELRSFDRAGKLNV